jgi:hypothetical protein
MYQINIYIERGLLLIINKGVILFVFEFVNSLRGLPCVYVSLVLIPFA